MRAKAEAIAARLSAATGSDVRRANGPTGLRLEADLPAELSAAARIAVLAALADADHYGHERTPDADYVWAVIGPGET